MKSLIIAVVGKSGSGKTTLTKEVDKFLGIESLVSYTTRPKRNEEINGIDHWFVDESEIPTYNEMLAYTLYGNYHYWVSVEQVKHGLIYTYVINEDALLEMLDRFKDVYDFVKIYVDRPNIDVSEDRTKRDIDRTELGKSFYDYIIVNDGSYRDFVKRSLNCVKQIVKNRI